jgi:cell wall-associated NlpC family hydrolase
MVRRKETGVVASSGYSRGFLSAFSAVVLAVTACVALTSTARADPPPGVPTPPPSATDIATQQLNLIQQQAEALTEQWHAAQDDLRARQSEAARASAAAGPAQAASNQAQQEMSAAQAKIDQLTSDALVSGRLDELNAVVMSDSPSDYLDQMTTLDTFSADQQSELDQAVAEVGEARYRKQQSNQTVLLAQQATMQAQQAAYQIGLRKQEADLRIQQVQTMLAQLSPADKAARTQSDGVPLGVILGNNRGALALRAAMTRMESPYVWGATGPSTFDCSGLVYWAFKRVGITMPRSSAEQAQVGRPVARSDLRPGDLIFFYQPVSHVGFYAGDGLVLNAVQTGDVVRYTELSRMDYTSARRL